MEKIINTLEMVVLVAMIGFILLIGKYTLSNYQDNIQRNLEEFQNSHMTGGTYTVEGNLIDGMTYHYYGWFGYNDEYHVDTLDLLFD